MSLKSLDHKWSEYLSKETCPPVLGLAPLTESESDQIHALVQDEIQIREYLPYQVLRAALRIYPSCISVWLARKAGEAYEAGAFWEKFCDLIGVELPVIFRHEFAQCFRWSCRKMMSVWVPPRDVGTQHIVGEFLYQAGLPLDRCAGFAQHIRKVERTLGLPEPDDPDSGAQLCTAVLESLESIPVPSLKRALRGPAGPKISEVALRVILEGNYDGINPRLGQELQKAFQNAAPGSLRRSAHQPYLRLAEDLASLEVVGPRQDPKIIAPGGLTWVVNGRRFPTPRTDEFVFPVGDHPRVVVELTGLSIGSMPPRTFIVRLDDLEDHCLLFDERSRRQRRTDGELPPGGYWLLHSTSDPLTGADQAYEWTDGTFTLSHFSVRPGQDAILQGSADRQVRFSAAFTPFFEPVGSSIRTETGHPLFYGWEELPNVWVPAEASEGESQPAWVARVRAGDHDHVFPLVPCPDHAAGMTRFSIQAGDFLQTLLPGLHRISVVLTRGTYSRTEAQVEYLYWQGLDRHDKTGFWHSRSPVNLVRSRSRGFAFRSNGISHLIDHHRVHTLVFDVEGTFQEFRWSQPGVFLESLERMAGRGSEPTPHSLGETFSANLDSRRSLRIWLAGQRGWELLVAGRHWQSYVAGDQRSFVEISLESLATSFPQGGDIVLRFPDGEHHVARFSSPLQPLRLEPIENEHYSGYRFLFTERATWVRPHVRDLQSGTTHLAEAQRFEALPKLQFSIGALPPIVCASHASGTSTGLSQEFSVEILVPAKGWPEGFWLIELQVRRDDNAEWGPLMVAGQEHAPVVIHNLDGHDASRIRSVLFRAALTREQDPADFPVEESVLPDLSELLADLIDFSHVRLVAQVRHELSWLRQGIRWLGRLAGRAARTHNGSGLNTRLLTLACQDSSHVGFVHLPGLLALPSGQYRELPTGGPLNEALRRCGLLTRHDTIAAAVTHDSSTIAMELLACFANFASVASASDLDTNLVEFSGFDHDRYWNQVLGTLWHDRLAPDWSGESTLGKDHMVWALSALVQRYDNPPRDLNLAAANALLHRAPELARWLRRNLESRGLMMRAAWSAPWPRFSAPEVDFLEATPRFASLFALAARAAAAGWLDFDQTLSWLEARLDRAQMVEDGITALVTLAPELFGHQLLFWEVIIRTAPPGDDA